jgi:hypothetical protein
VLVDPETELEQLRSRVSQLEQHLDRMLADQHAAAPASPVVSGTSADGFSRRRMLRNGLGLSAAAVAGVGMLDAVGSAAAATDGDAVKVAQTVSPTAFDSAPTRITNPSPTHFSPVLFQVDNSTDDSLALPGDTRASIFATMAGHDTNVQVETAILGMSTNGSGVKGHSEGDVGVVGTSTFAAGVSGTAAYDAGVLGSSTSGPGVKGTSTNGHGLVGITTSSAPTSSASTGSGPSTPVSSGSPTASA